MAIDSILSQIDAEIERLTQVRKLLAGSGVAATHATTRTSRTKAPAKSAAKKTRVLSPEARKRIADAQRRRWAAQRSKTPGKKESGGSK